MNLVKRDIANKKDIYGLLKNADVPDSELAIAKIALLQGILDTIQLELDTLAPQIQSDWNQASTSALDYIKNKPSIPVVSDLAYDATAWNGNPQAPSKNAVRDKIEAMMSSLLPAGSQYALLYHNGSTWIKTTKLLLNESAVQLDFNNGAFKVIANGQITSSSLTASRPLLTDASKNIVSGSFGSTAGTFCEGNDTRLSNSRTPTAHATTHKIGGSDSLRLSDLDIPTSNIDFNYTQLWNALLPNLAGAAIINYGLALGTTRKGVLIYNTEDDQIYKWDGYNWILISTPDLSGYILKSLIDAKGDLLIGTADNTISRLAVGADGTTLIADSTQPTGYRFGTLTGVGEANTASNLGTGIGAFKSKIGVDLGFKSFKGYGHIGVIASGADEIQISTSAEANTASNLGSTTGRKNIFDSKSGEDLRFKSLVAGDGIDLSTAVSGEIKVSQKLSSQTLTSFSDLNFSLENRVLFFDGTGTDNLQITSIPDGVECKIVITANGGDIRLDFPIGDFVEGGFNQWTISSNTAHIFKVISINNRAYWTIGNVMTQI